MELYLLRKRGVPPRFFLAVASAVLALFMHGQPLKAEGVDKLFEKLASEKTWGQILADAVGHDGFSKSYALVVGISDYTGGYSNLPTARDAKRMADYLIEDAGFDHVRLLTEEKVTRSRVAELMNDVFPELLDRNDRFLFYWSGHGDTRGRASGTGSAGYLPVSDAAYKRWSQMIAMADVKRWQEFLPARQTVFLLDACFSGLAGVEAKAPTMQDLRIEQLAQRGHHVLSAGTEGEEVIAADRWDGSLFTTALIDGLRGAADATTAFERDGVVSLTELKSYLQTRILHERLSVGWREQITPQMRDLDHSAGEFFFLTKEEVEKVSRDGGIDLAQAPVSRKAPLPSPLSTLRDCDDCPEMVVIPEGRFIMGSPTDEEGRSRDEGPTREVVVKSFALGKHEVTFAEWDACFDGGGCSIRPDDHGWGRGDRPVINVSWRDAQDYVSWLSDETRQRYRLPSEAEWEYAARGNSQARFFWGDRIDDACAFANGNDETSSLENGFALAKMPCDDGHAQTAEVGSLEGNRFGLYDMIGNVWEWVEDTYHRNYSGAPGDGSVWTSGDSATRVLRGGSWNFVPLSLRSAKRDWDEPDFRGNVVGFRVARDLEP